MAADRTRAHRASIPAAAEAFFEDDRGKSAMPEVPPAPVLIALILR